MFRLIPILLSLCWLPAAAQDSAVLNQKLEVNCVQCHADPATGAPLMGDISRWRQILQQDKQQVLRNIYLGKNGMPPLGYCSSCSAVDFVQLTRLMAGQPDNSDTELSGGW